MLRQPNLSSHLSTLSDLLDGCLRWVIAIAATSLIAGCSTATIMDPDRTTYPREAIRQQNVIMPLTPGMVTQKTKVDVGNISYQSESMGRPSLEFKQTIVGDTAEHEEQIVSEPGRTTDEPSLRSRIPEVGKRVCGGQYHVSYSKFYTGSEATSGYMGINRPWLKVIIRCPLSLNVQNDRNFALVSAVSKEIEDAEYFDIHQSRYQVTPQALEAAIERVLVNRKGSIQKKFQSGDSNVVVSERYRMGIIGFPVYEQLVAVLSPNAQGSLLTMRLLAHSVSFNGLSGTFKPERRDFTYRRVQKLLGEVQNSLKSP